MSIGGSKGSSSGNSSSTQVVNQNSSATPNNLGALQTGWNAAGNLLGSTNWGNILGAGVNEADLGTTTANGINSGAAGATNSFTNGDNVNNPANAYLTPYANGSQVGTQNPGFQGVVDQISRSLQPQIDGSYGAAGRYGSGANANAFAGALTNAVAPLAYQNYTTQQGNQLTAAGQLSTNNATGRQQQLTAAGLAPSLTASNFIPSAALTGLGFAGPSQYQGVVAAGNPGGTTSSSGTATGTGAQSGNTSQFGGGLSFGNVPLFGK